MALGNVFISDTDGNIPSNVSSGNEKVTGLLFDISLQPTLFTAGVIWQEQRNKTKAERCGIYYQSKVCC